MATTSERHLKCQFVQQPIPTDAASDISIGPGARLRAPVVARGPRHLRRLGTWLSSGDGYARGLHLRPLLDRDEGVGDDTHPLSREAHGYGTPLGELL